MKTKEKKVYVCEICSNESESKQAIEQCEASHYVPLAYNVDKDSYEPGGDYPKYIIVQFEKMKRKYRIDK